MSAFREDDDWLRGPQCRRQPTGRCWQIVSLIGWQKRGFCYRAWSIARSSTKPLGASFQNPDWPSKFRFLKSAKTSEAEGSLNLANHLLMGTPAIAIPQRTLSAWCQHQPSSASEMSRARAWSKQASRNSFSTACSVRDHACQFASLNLLSIISGPGTSSGKMRLIRKCEASNTGNPVRY